MREQTLASWIPLLLLLLASGPAAGQGGEYLVRLAVCREAPVTRVQAPGLSLHDADVLDVVLRGSDRALTIKAAGEGLDITGVKHRPRSVLLFAPGPIQVDGRRLVGEVEVTAEPGRGLLVVNRLPLERYLEGVLGAEMSPSWPLEALKAQAVAARSYFLHRRLSRESEPFDLAATTLDQVYQGIGQEAERTRQAVQATRGEVLAHGNQPAEALFHACCGGRTRTAEQAFGRAVAYLKAVEDPDCAACPRRTWQVRVPIQRLAERLQARGALRGPVREVRRGPAGELEVHAEQGGVVRLAPRELRRLVGVTEVPADGFEWRPVDGTLELDGRGRGHRVGMCQWGARGLAERGRSYREILDRFYPGCRLRKLY